MWIRFLQGRDGKLALTIALALPLSAAHGQSVPQSASFVSPSASRADAPSGPIRMEPLSPSETPPTYVMRGGPVGPARLVFLHGMCGHALGYAQSFQFT